MVFVWEDTVDLKESISREREWSTLTAKGWREEEEVSEQKWWLSKFE